MSNPIHLNSCEFKNPVTNEVTYGYTMYDTYGQSYNNTLEANITDAFELFKQAVNSGDDAIGDMVIYLIDRQTGVTINGTYYIFEVLRKYLRFE